MIRNTYRRINARDGVLSAYSDNAAVIEGPFAEPLLVPIPGDESGRVPGDVVEPAHILMKVETHNHPTAIAPYPGAATGFRRRDPRRRAPTGRGSKLESVGLVGYTTYRTSTSPAGTAQPWEQDPIRASPDRIASASRHHAGRPHRRGGQFNNEYGRPATSAGYFRTFEFPHARRPEWYWGYHKPIMIAGGVWRNIRSDSQVEKLQPTSRKARNSIVLGGPAMLIGLGGGAASSHGQRRRQGATPSSTSPQCSATIAEMQRRCPGGHRPPAGRIGSPATRCAFRPRRRRRAVCPTRMPEIVQPMRIPRRA